MTQLSTDTATATDTTTTVQLLVPVYNEGENVRTLFENLKKENIAFDSLMFVYDFDGDTTVPVIEELEREDSRVVSERNDFGKGVLHALRWGFSKAKPGPLIVLMADNSDKLSIIPEMISLWKQGCTIVVPSRYMKGGKQHGGGLIKSSMSRVAGLSLKILGFPVSDPTNNFKLYDGEWIKSQKIESVGGFEIALELCYKAYTQGKKQQELPTEWFDRTLGDSNFKFRAWLPKYLHWYFKSLGAIFKKSFVL